MVQDLAKCDNRDLKVTSRDSVLKAVLRWLTVITASERGSLADVRKFYPLPDQVGKTLHFNVGEGNYRHSRTDTHAEYDRVNVEALCR